MQSVVCVLIMFFYVCVTDIGFQSVVCFSNDVCVTGIEIQCAVTGGCFSISNQEMKMTL